MSERAPIVPSGDRAPTPARGACANSRAGGHVRVAHGGRSMAPAAPTGKGGARALRTSRGVRATHLHLAAGERGAVGTRELSRRGGRLTERYWPGPLTSLQRARWLQGGRGAGCACACRPTCRRAGLLSACDFVVMSSANAPRLTRAEGRALRQRLASSSTAALARPPACSPSARALRDPARGPAAAGTCAAPRACALCARATPPPPCRVLARASERLKAGRASRPGSPASAELLSMGILAAHSAPARAGR
jgi:hypothetical protein